MHLIRAHFKQRKISRERHKRIINDACAILVSDYLYKSIYCGCSFELP